MVPFTRLLHAPLLFTYIQLAVNALKIPTQGGPYCVSISELSFNDPARTDPYAQGKHDRTVMVSLFFPITASSCTRNCTKEYMPSETSQISSENFRLDSSPDLFEDLEFQTCCSSNKISHPKDFPLVILNTAVATSRHLYGGIAQAIAAHGYAVITVDHPYDASIVEFPGSGPGAINSTVYNSIPLSPFSDIRKFNHTITQAMQTRFEDIDLVIRNLANPMVVKQLMPSAPYGAAFNTSNMGIMGHGVGGGVAVWLAFTDARFVVGIDFDGTPPIFKEETTQGVVFFGREGHTRDEDIGWRETWGMLRGASWEWDLQESAHFDYSDLGLVVDLKGMESGSVRGLGDVEGRMAWNATVDFSVAYLDAFVKGRGLANLQGLVALYPGMVPYGG
ncbi:hypothetical protein GQ43DRAFT_498480 [Delitschia confertaspora ATCC 74209]|uniref:1-alkyl-2-acetylglycerophosphocholine esterase n=1 Tax=Delitschia confertaspora ATCC 74209 TaxID=1513339 RepID=A0A9P4MR20_9PLEO|nr:hypothetical protein GQ43DRAFT_498480 [Delitschia confertaspora ATCC 74209]